MAIFHLSEGRGTRGRRGQEAPRALQSPKGLCVSAPLVPSGHPRVAARTATPPLSGEAARAAKREPRLRLLRPAKLGRTARDRHHD